MLLPTIGLFYSIVRRRFKSDNPTQSEFTVKQLFFCSLFFLFSCNQGFAQKQEDTLSIPENPTYYDLLNSYLKEYPVMKEEGKKREGVDLIAQLYPFNELVWTYHGERINIPALVRYMFTDFVKSSALF
jgi:hypothetical protein